MATFHCGVKIGIKGKTIPHLDYIKRENKYSNREDLISTKSGHLPSWAKDDTEFWQEINNHEQKRTYREIVFALPNELTEIEQQQLVNEYIEQVIPHNPYTYAIHSTDSSIHGVKNPHLHLMFSERINDDHVKNLSKDEWFKQRGVSKKGEEFGGSKKDRSWAGTGRTKKYYEIRDHLANMINQKLEEKGLNVRVSAKSLEEEANIARQQGNNEKASGKNTKRAIRIHHREYIPFSKYIQEKVNDTTPIDPLIPLAIQERIEKLRNNATHQERLENIQEYNTSIKPTIDDYSKATKKVATEIKDLMDVYTSPYSIIKNKLEEKIVESYDADYLHIDEYTYASIIASEDVSESIETELSSDPSSHDNTVLMLADIYINKERLTVLEKELENAVKNTDDILFSILPKEEKELLLKLEKDLKQTIKAIDWAEHDGAQCDHFYDRKHKIEYELMHYKQQMKYTHKEKYQQAMNTLVNDYMKTSDTLKKLKVLYNKGYKTLPENKRSNIKNAVDTIKRVDTKHKYLADFVQQETKRQLKEVIHNYNQSKRIKTIQDFVDKEIDSKYNNVLKKEKEKLRSQYSKLNYNQKQGKDTSENTKAIYELEQTIEKIRRQYTTTDIVTIANQKYQAYSNKQKKKIFTPNETKQQFKRIMRKPHGYKRFNRAGNKIIKKLTDASKDLTSNLNASVSSDGIRIQSQEDGINYIN